MQFKLYALDRTYVDDLRDAASLARVLLKKRFLSGKIAWLQL